MRYILLLACCIFAGHLFAQVKIKNIEETVNEEKIKSHVYFFASDALKGRDTGSPGLAVAAEYIKAHLTRYGVKAFDEYPNYMQAVPLTKKAPPKSGELKVGDIALNYPDEFVMFKGSDAFLTGDVVFLNHGLEQDYEGVDVQGKIVVALCGKGEESHPRFWFRMGKEKRALAEKAGAVALVEIYQPGQVPWNILKQFFQRETMSVDKGDTDYPHFWIIDEENKVLNESKTNSKSGSIEIAGSNQSVIDSYNLVGYLEGSDPELKDEFIVYSAHYDHVGIGKPTAEGDSIYNGARDNAIGTSTVLTIAENMAKYRPKRSALFIFFTAEEKGLLGSEYFVDHSPVPLKDIVYCFNSDNGGYNDVTKATIIGLGRTTADDLMIKACAAFGLEAIADQMPEQNLFDRSDNVNFAKKGIPAPTFGMGVTAFDDAIKKTYHQPIDHAETVDYAYLNKFFKSYLYAAHLIADMKERPFWLEGDKYYKAGLELYQ